MDRYDREIVGSLYGTNNIAEGIEDMYDRATELLKGVTRARLSPVGLAILSVAAEEVAKLRRRVEALEGENPELLKVELPHKGLRVLANWYGSERPGTYLETVDGKLRVHLDQDGDGKEYREFDADRVTFVNAVLPTDEAPANDEESVDG